MTNEEKKLIMSTIKKNMVDLMRIYDYHCIKVELNCNAERGEVKINITEYNI